MVKRALKDKGGRGYQSSQKRERKRWCRRKEEEENEAVINNGKTRRDSKLASVKREQESRGTRTRRRPNGGSLSSRGSATGMQCGLCAVLAGLFRRAMCIAGSRRGSGESCYQELATEIQQVQQLQQSTHNRSIPVHQISSASFVCTAATSPTTGSPVYPLARRSGSFGSVQRLREPIQQERTNEEIIVDRTGTSAVFVRISEDASLPSSGESPTATTSATCPSEQVSKALRRLSDTDRILIENLDVGRCRTRHTGRFLTMHKRRRKRLITRSLNQEPGLLDDIFHGQVQCVLQRAGNWRFNAFTLETVTGGRSLPVLCVHLFQWYGLFQRFNLDVVRVWKLFALIEEGYHSTNPYHNSIHAADVTQAMHCFLQEEKIKRHLSSLEIMASLIAAVTHDLDHPGVNQPFLVATSNHLATLYENTSVLENHHWRSAIGCLLESGVSEQLPAQVRPELQRHISSLILATDITRQQEFLTRFKSCIDDNTLNMEKPENRHFILQISLKCADISNPCRPWDISRKWSYKVCEEFFRQGDYERQLNLPVTPVCDRQSISIPKIQAGFFQFVVTPLYDEWHRFLGDGLSVSLMLHLRTNQKRWEALIAQEVAEETKTEMSDLEEVENSSGSEDERVTDTPRDYTEESVNVLSAEVDESETCDRRPPSVLPPGQLGPRRVNRRHSVPLSVTKPGPLLPRAGNASRRESLPGDRLTSRNHHGMFLLQDIIRGEDALERLSSLSLISSKSSIYESVGNASLSCERPVSAENLLPETSIASITSSVEASRLSTVLQPENQKSSQSKHHLTRQQTFPPLQPYARIRYMSTTAEMSRCRTETVMEAEDSSTSGSDPSSRDDKSEEAQRCGTCSEADCQSWRLRKTECGHARISRQHTTDNRGCSSRRRESAFSDLTRQSLDPGGSSSIGRPDFPRRHSVQTAVRAEDSGLKNRHRRPSSAQEAYPAQAIYASLIGAAKTPKKANRSGPVPGADSRPDSRTDSSASRGDNNVLEIGPSKNTLRSAESASSVANSPTPTSDMYSVLSEDPGQAKESEFRRYSTPATNTKVAAASRSENPGGRRFTAIPVTSELPTHKVFFIGSPPASPPRIQSSSSDSSESKQNSAAASEFGSETVAIGSKRDSEGSRQKSSKVPKLSDDARMKENVDPRNLEESNKTGISTARRTITQGWARRRGSAPVGLLARLDDCPIAVAAVAPRIDRHSSRRGSVPADISGHHGGSFRSALGPRGENVPSPRRASLPQEAALSNLLGNILLPGADRENLPSNNNNNNNSSSSNNNNNNNNSNNSSAHVGSGNNNGSSRVPEGVPLSGGMSSPRRGSVPADISELRRDLFGRNSVNGKARNRKKTLRRRSSGGPEMFAGGNVDDNENGKWLGWKRDLKRETGPDGPSVKRRGSLPVEMVSIFHPGSAAAGRRSSLWRL